jgi:hypothetical protein
MSWLERGAERRKGREALCSFWKGFLLQLIVEVGRENKTRTSNKFQDGRWESKAEVWARHMGSY